MLAFAPFKIIGFVPVNFEGKMKNIGLQREHIYELIRRLDQLSPTSTNEALKRVLYSNLSITSVNGQITKPANETWEEFMNSPWSSDDTRPTREVLFWQLDALFTTYHGELWREFLREYNLTST